MSEPQQHGNNPNLYFPETVFGISTIRLGHIFAIALILLVGLLVRFDSWSDWQAKPYRSFYEGSPLIINVDGYYYLSLARNLVEGQYKKSYQHESESTQQETASVPPMLSVVTAVLATVTPFSINSIAVFLPVFLGMLVCIPVFLIGRLWGGYMMGYSSALATAISPYYVNRTSLGWYDTDGLILFIIIMSIWLFMRYAGCVKECRWTFMLGGLLTWVAGVWAWDQAPAVVTVLVMYPFLLALYIRYKSLLHEARWVVIFVFCMVGLVLYFTSYGAYDSFTAKILYVMKFKSGPFSLSGGAVSEQEALAFNESMNLVAGHAIVYLIAVAGLILLAYKIRIEFLFLLPIILLSLAGLIYANRFLVFSAPLFGIAIGYFVCLMGKYIGSARKTFLLIPFLAFALCYPAYLYSINNSRFQSINSIYISGMSRINEITPADAVIWSWWTEGYPLQYWGDRATVTDGSRHDDELSVYNALPLSSRDQRLAANFIHFFVNHGRAGLMRFYEAYGGESSSAYNLLLNIFSAGPSGAPVLLEEAKMLDSHNVDARHEWLEFLFARADRPVYLYINFRQIQSGWWYWFGAWDPVTQSGHRPFIKEFYNASEYSVGDLKHSGLVSTYHRDSGLLIAADNRVASSVLWQLFVDGKVSRYFELVEDGFPSHRIWSVSSDDAGISE